MSGCPGWWAKRRSSNVKDSPGLNPSAMSRSLWARSRRVAAHSSMLRNWATRLLHNAFNVAQAACLSFSVMVTVMILIVLVSRLTDSSLPSASRL